MDKHKLKIELKVHLVKCLNLFDHKPEEIEDNQPLFSSGLGLDSIDSLELMVMLERFYGVKITNPAEGRKIMFSIEAMADYIIDAGTIKN